MIARIGLKIGIDLKARVSPSSGPKKRSPGKPRIVKLNILADPLPFAIILLSYIVVLLLCVIALLETRAYLAYWG